MEAHTNVKTTFTLSGTQAGGLWHLFEHDLGSHQYRSFTNGKMVITVFNDNGLVRTGSTCFRIAEPDTSMVPPNLATTTNLPEVELLLSLNSVEILKTLSHEDLQKHASKLGKSSSKLFPLCW